MLDTILDAAQNIGMAIGIIIFSIIYCHQYIKKATSKLPIGVSVKKQNEEDLRIHEAMEHFKELLKADRVMVFEFHNGQHYSNYRSALKLSASYEVYRAGLTSNREKCTNLPISIMPAFISEITTKGIVECKNLEDIKEKMPNTYHFKKSLGIQAFYDVAIKDKDNNIIGFVAIQWTEAIPEEAEQHREVLNDYVKHLAWYMEEEIKKLTMMKGIKQKKKISFFNK